MSTAIKVDKNTEIGITLRESEPLEGLVFEDCYTVTKRLRAGSYGTVYVARHLRSDQDLAVKILDRTKLKKKDDDAVFREVAVMRELIGVPGVIRLMDFFVSPEKFYVVQEWAEGGDVSCIGGLVLCFLCMLYSKHLCLFLHRCLISWPREQPIPKRMLENCH